MSKPIDVLGLLNDPQFLFTWAETPGVVEKEAKVIEAFLRERYQTTPTTQPKPRYSVVGTRRLRPQDVPRLKGTAKFTHDVRPEGTLYAAILYSPHAHARIKSIDTSKAEALPGVRAVVTSKNVYDTGAPKTPIYTHPDRFILQDEVLFAGDEVAGVAADDLYTARQAVNLIEVDYEVLPASVGDPEAATRATAPPTFFAGAKAGETAPAAAGAEAVAAASLATAGSPTAARNLGPDFKSIKVGDVGAGFAQADVTLDGRYETATLQHGPLEAKSIVALWDNDQLTAWVSSQWTHGARSTLAKTLGVPISKVRVICDYIGGGFGDKSSTSVDRFAYITAILSKMTGMPVKLHYSRPEEFTSSIHKAANVILLKAGVKRDGTLTALHAGTYADQGAWNGASGSAQSSQESQQTVYQYGAAQFDQYNVITNRYRTGPMRDVNESSGVFSLEVHMDRLAEALGMDPVDFRLKNMTQDLSPLDKLPLTSNGLRDCVLKGAEAFGWKSKWHAPAARITGRKAHGVGMGVFASQKGSQSAPMSGVVKIELDGSVTVLTGVQDVGAGQLTTMLMIAAEELGAKFEDCQSYGGDSAFTTETGVTAASRQTKSGGTGIRLAAADAKQQLYALAMGPQPGNKPPLIPAKAVDELDSEGSVVFLRADPSKKATFKQVMGLSPNIIIGKATVVPPPSIAQRAFGATFTELEVDLDTGEVTILDYVAAHDVGKVINPYSIEQQFDGGSVMGFGFCLAESLRVDPTKGFSLNSNYENYPIATALDVPKRSRALWIESIDKIGPFGAKGMGEPVTTGPVASVPNAIYNAIGVRIYQTPYTRARILQAIREKGLRPA